MINASATSRDSDSCDSDADPSKKSDNIYETIDNEPRHDEWQNRSPVINSQRDQIFAENFYEDIRPCSNSDWRFKTRDFESKTNIDTTINDIQQQQMASDNDGYEEIGRGFVADKLKLFQTKLKVFQRKEQKNVKCENITKYAKSNDYNNIASPLQSNVANKDNVDAVVVRHQLKIDAEQFSNSDCPYQKQVKNKDESNNSNDEKQSFLNENQALKKLSSDNTKCMTLGRQSQTQPREEFINALNSARQKLEFVSKLPVVPSPFRFSLYWNRQFNRARDKRFIESG